MESQHFFGTDFGILCAAVWSFCTLVHLFFDPILILSLIQITIVPIFKKLYLCKVLVQLLGFRQFLTFENFSFFFCTYMFHKVSKYRNKYSFGMCTGAQVILPF